MIELHVAESRLETSRTCIVCGAPHVVARNFGSVNRASDDVLRVDLFLLLVFTLTSGTFRLADCTS